MQTTFPAADETESVAVRKKEPPITPVFTSAAASSEKFDDIHIELEKEIDNLFVPAAEYRNEGPIKTGDKKQKTQGMFPAADKIERPPARKKARPSPALHRKRATNSMTSRLK